ncbi:MAG: cell envelope integrity protein CreD [Tannerella sp.]|jgi:inner membrane protein|nr:cell envelope integrity protein CreD [Tannerella sp.]
MDSKDFGNEQKQAVFQEPASGFNPQRQINSPQSFFSRFRMVFKSFIIGFLTLLLLIPMFMIGNLIREREETAGEASNEVRQKWSGAQTIMGPILTVPFQTEQTGLNNEGKKETKTVVTAYQILPESLEISGQIRTRELERGLYEVVVYNAPLELKGSFVAPEELISLVKAGGILFDEVTLDIGISDMRGIVDRVLMDWGGRELVFNPGIRHNKILTSGISVAVDLNSLVENQTVAFSAHIELKGSQSLMFAPLGKTTRVKLESNCNTPSFTGAYLPNERNVENGFTGEWKIMHLNRNYPQAIYGDEWQHDVSASVFGVEMLIPVQHYQKAMRSVKYAILIILLTFVTCFFVEIIQKKNIHPFQYLLVGLALCLFYALLVSISEHAGFCVAYVIASLMTVLLLASYMAGILKAKKMAFSIGGLLALLYLYIFVLIQMETYALLAGSIGLFVILAVIMYFSQRIKWGGK